MPDLRNPAVVKKIIGEINTEEEKTRRILALRRHDIYRDGGKRFLLEQIEREFSHDAIKEMRLAPVNLLKKIVNKRSGVYKKPPIRRANSEGNQALVDFYVKETGINQVMRKANIYFNLFSNTAIYPIVAEGKILTKVVPPYLYSIVPNPLNLKDVDVWVFNSFSEEQEVFEGNESQKSATGLSGFDREKGTKAKNDLVASGEFETKDQRRFIFWSDEFHFTTDSSGVPVALNPAAGIEQFSNPFGTSPVVNLTKDRDNEPWAKQGEDLVDLTLAIQSGWSDLLSIAKEQGFSLLTVKSEEEPTKMTIGLNRAVWLKLSPDGPTPDIGYVTAQSNLEDYKNMLMDLLGLLLTTNDMSATEVGGIQTSRTFTSGFHAMIEMSSTIEAIEADKPFLRDAEMELWDKIKIMHNTLHDVDGLDEKFMDMGKFSDDFDLEIIYGDVKPIESEKEVQAMVLDRINNGLMTRRQALMKLNPDIPQEEIEAMIEEISKEESKKLASLRSIEDDEDEEIEKTVAGSKI